MAAAVPAQRALYHVQCSVPADINALFVLLVIVRGNRSRYAHFKSRVKFSNA